MKKLFFLTGVIFFAKYTVAQSAFNDDVFSKGEVMYASSSSFTSSALPQPIRDAWSRDYATIKEATWFKLADEYVVTYVYKNFQSRVQYDVDGNVKMHSREVDSASAPILVFNFMKKKYPGIQYGKIFMSYPVKGENIYEIQVGDTWERFDVNGNNIEDKTLLNRAQN